MFDRLLFVLAVSLAFLSVAAAQERMPMIPTDKLTEAQKKTVAGMQGGSFAVGGPFIALLREPKLAEQAVAMATYFRARGSPNSSSCWWGAIGHSNSNGPRIIRAR
jgi:hypothetical protein